MIDCGCPSQLIHDLIMAAAQGAGRAMAEDVRQELLGLDVPRHCGPSDRAMLAACAAALLNEIDTLDALDFKTPDIDD